MSGDRISSSRGLNASYATEESSYNTKLGDGGSKFKMGCSPKKGFPEKTISDRKSNIEKFIENNQVIKLTKKFNLNGDEKEPKTGMKLGIEVKISNPKTLLVRDHLALYMMRKLPNLVMLIRIKKKII